MAAERAFPNTWLLTALGLLAACAANDGPAPGTAGPARIDADAATADGSRGTTTLRLVQANVGNLAPGCRGYAFNLCHADVEARLADRLRELDPDLVTLQELTSPAQCEAMRESDPGKACHGHPATAQVERLLGPDYTIACDQRGAYECIAIHHRAGRIEGCGPGLPCTAATAAIDDGCDAGFSVSGIHVELDGGTRVGVINGHPPSGGATSCRRDQLERALVSGEVVDLDGPVLLSGDFNLDPYSGRSDPSTELWNQWVGPERRFAYHSGEAETVPPFPTAYSLVSRSVLDHVASDLFEGSCQTLGPAPGTQRLDGGSGTDHRALLCDLRLPDASPGG